MLATWRWEQKVLGVFDKIPWRGVCRVSVLWAFASHRNPFLGPIDRFVSFLLERSRNMPHAGEEDDNSLSVISTGLEQRSATNILPCERGTGPCLVQSSPSWLVPYSPMHGGFIARTVSPPPDSYVARVAILFSPRHEYPSSLHSPSWTRSYSP